LAKQSRGKAPRTTKKKSAARKGASPRTAGRSAKASRTPRKPAAAKTASKAPARRPRPADRPSVAARPAARTAAARVAPPRAVTAKAAPPPVPAPQAAPAPPPPPRKPGFYEAVAIYERGVQALQRREMQTAAGHFRTVITNYPEERELLERSVVYLRVCEAPQPVQSQNEGDHVYAATVALNSGDHAGALNHLQRALSADDENDHAHYIMAATLSQRGRRDEALRHLSRSIALNSENRAQARQDPDLDNIREHPGFQAALNTPPVPRRRKTS
jgi:tetratricopeptide (TPR) repeat protein